MKADKFLNEYLDTANFGSLLSSAATPATQDAQHAAAAQAELHAEIKRITDYAKAHPDDEFVDANKKLISQGVGAETWTGVGNVSMTSFAWWTVGGGIAFPGLAPLAFLFGAKGGPNWAATSFTSVVGGSFVVNPKDIANSSEFHLEKIGIGWVRKGPCNFTLAQGGVGVGDVN